MTAVGTSPATRTIYWRDFKRGFVATMALWPGEIPFAVAYAALAREAGFSLAEIQAMSMLIYAGSAQLAIINLVSAGAGFFSTVLTALVLNLRHILYGISLNKQLPEDTTPPRPVLAFFLTDESYGLTIKDEIQGGGGPAFFFGTSISLYGAFAVACFIGAIAGERLAELTELGLEFVFPLTFLLLLVPLLRSRVDVIVAAISGALVLLLDGRMNSGAALLIAVLIAIGVGSRLPTRRVWP
jgi:4-azaleucine resistance transporter AzlC